MEDHDDIVEPQRPIDGYFRDLATCEVEPPVWIIQNLIPRGLTFIAGPPKSMKSTVTAAVAAIASGHTCHALPPFMSQPAAIGPVMWLSAEAGGGELKDMMVNHMGVKLEPNESILVADDPWEFRLDDPDGWQRLHEWLVARDPLITIIDPLAEFHQLDEKVAGEMVRMLRPIRKWAVENDSSVIIVHHTSKKQGDQKNENFDASDMRGSSALFGKADGIIMMSPKGNEEDRRAFVKATFKRGQGWQREVNFAVYNQQKRSAGTYLPKLAMEVKVLLDVGATKAEDIARQLNVGPSATKEALKALEENGLARKGKDGTWHPRKA